MVEAKDKDDEVREEEEAETGEAEEGEAEAGEAEEGEAEAGEAEAGEAEAGESEPRKPSDELKVVIVLKGDRAMVGIQSPDCDPIFTTLEGGLPAALSQVPALVESANAQWDANPQNPKADLPEEPEPVASSTRNTTAPRPAKPNQQVLF